MKFKELTLKNFQSHKNSTIELSEGLNVITGPTDSGKSSIIRAIKLLVTNRPSGDSYRTHDSKVTQVSASDGTSTVLRKKSSQLNQYLVNGKSYKAIGSEVPSDVTSTLNLKPVNIQEQKDHFFLLNDTPGQVSKQLNEVAGLSGMDKSLMNVGTSIRSITSDIKYTEERITELEIEIEEVAWADDAQKLCTEILTLEKKRDTVQDKIDYLTNIIETVEDLKAEQANLLPVELFKDVDAILLLKKELDSIAERKSTIQFHFERVKTLSRQQKELQLIDTTELQTLVDSMYEISNVRNKIIAIVDVLNRNKKRLATEDTRLKLIQDKLSQFNLCPTCGKPI